MSLNVKKEIAALDRMTVGELHERFIAVFGEPVRSRHRQYLIRRIAWRLQANAEGGLSDRALRRAEELANIADVRVMPPRLKTINHDEMLPRADALRVRMSADPRLPQVGSQIIRKHKGLTVAVSVLADGFEFEGERYRSLSAIAKAVTGSHINGFRFFHLEGKA